MNKNIFLLMIFVSVISCASGGGNSDDTCPNCNNNPPPKIPEKITISVTTDNYIVVNSRLITDISPLKGIKYAGRYRSGSTLYFKIEAVPPEDFFWLAKVPPVKSGTHQLVATKIAKLNKLDLKNAPPSREKIKINIVVKEGVISSVIIEDPGTQTLGLYLFKTYRNNKGQQIGVIKSKLYVSQRWEVIFPKEYGNGNFTIIAVRQ